MSDKEYWEEYYKNHFYMNVPSLFADFCLEYYLKEKMNLIELGCGNGRDAFYFAKNNINVLGIDQCNEGIKENQKEIDTKNFKFLMADFSQLGNIGYFDAIYSRFTMHAINDEQENNVLNWASKYLTPEGYFLIEARGTENEYYGLGETVKDENHAYIYENHYRRFIDKKTFVEKLISNNFEILQSDEESARAPFNGTDYKYLRVIAKKR